MKKIAFIFIMFVISFTLNAQARTTIFPDGNAFKEFPFRFGYVFNFDYKMEHGKWLRIRR